MAEKEENKYLVLKWDRLLDLVKEDDELKRSLNHLIYEYNNSNSYIVVNQDEPYAEEVWQLILKREDEK